jgi:tRNA-specific 2-thiouridylase
MKIALLISGGVDSSVALRLLTDAGHEVHAFYLKIWLEDELSYLGSCPWEQDLSFITPLCASLGVPLTVVPLQNEYARTIIAYVVDQAKRGCTPSPDVLCNQYIKFGAFFSHIDASYERVATGHYALQRTGQGHNQLLCRGVDTHKDQSYFLSMLSQEQVNRALFPIGHLHKAQVRALAEQYGVPSKQRKDSQGICFLGKISYTDFLRHHCGVMRGELIEFETDRVVGAHEGYWLYTIGQRQGLGLSGGPWYVVAKSVSCNRVYISRSYGALAAMRTAFRVSGFHWIDGLSYEGEVLVKMRHGQHVHRATVRTAPSGAAHGTVQTTITLHEPDQGVASGQFAVVYKEDVCLGAGMIETSLTLLA